MRVNVIQIGEALNNNTVLLASDGDQEKATQKPLVAL
jgi:hypothetical protein